MKNIVLVGLMGAGKTSVGKLLAEKLSYSFCDTDDLIEKEAGQTISQIFEKFGENYFRELETDIIRKISLITSSVISTGGGSLEKEENIELLKTNSFLVYLQAAPTCLYERVKKESHRPLLKNSNPLQTLENLLKKREAHYLRADLLLNTEDKNVAILVDEIIKVYNENV